MASLGALQGSKHLHNNDCPVRAVAFKNAKSAWTGYQVSFSAVGLDKLVSALMLSRLMPARLTVCAAVTLLPRCFRDIQLTPKPFQKLEASN